MCSKGVYILSFSYLTSYDSASLDLINNYKTSREARCKTGWPVSRCTQFSFHACMTSAPRLIIGGDLLFYYKMQHNVPKHLSKCSFISASLTYFFYISSPNLRTRWFGLAKWYANLWRHDGWCHQNDGFCEKSQTLTIWKSFITLVCLIIYYFFSQDKLIFYKIDVY